MNKSELRAQLGALRRQYDALSKELDGRASSSLSAEAALKLAIFDRLPMPIWACDRECRIVYWNGGAERLYGYRSDEAMGRDFVELFVNPPERLKARLDCVDIIENDRNIRNMADDIDKYGTTRRLVTQCFALYNVGGHDGIQVELSYEVQDIDRLGEELRALQADFRRAQDEREQLRRRLIDTTRAQGLAALEREVTAAKESIRDRKKIIEAEALGRGADQEIISKARAAAKAELERVIRWEREMRNRLLTEEGVAALEKLIEAIEKNESFDV